MKRRAGDSRNGKRRSGRVEEFVARFGDVPFGKPVENPTARVVDAHHDARETLDEAHVDAEISRGDDDGARAIDESPGRALTKRGKPLAEAPHFFEFGGDHEMSGVIDVSPFPAPRCWTEPLAERPDAAAIPVELRLDRHLAAAVDESGMATHLDAGKAIGEIARVLVSEGHDDLAGRIDESIFSVED